MVDEKKLAELVAAKTDMSLNEVEEQLEELTQNIQAAGEADEAFKIEGLGTFKQERNETRFEPDQVLETEINQKYAGMRPIELMGSFKETEKNRVAPPVEVSGEIDKPVQSEPKIGPEPVEQKPKPNKVEEKVKSEEKSEAPPEDKPTKKVKEPASADETGIGAIILIILAVIVAILLAGWLLYNTGVFSNGDTNVNSPVETAAVVKNVGLENATSKSRVAITSGGGKKGGLSSVGKNSSFKESENVSLYGLMGTMRPKANDGYTIIVHSLVRKKRAVKTLESIKQQGYRTVMLKAHVNGTMYWRLGIGQFKTIADAQKAANTLQEPYKSNHFIKHL